MLSPVVEAEDGPQEDREDPLTIYPEGGYWALASSARLRMLRALCCDALDTALIRCPFTGLTLHVAALLAAMGCCLARASPTWARLNLQGVGRVMHAPVRSLHSACVSLYCSLSINGTQNVPCIIIECSDGRQRIDDGFDAAAAEEKRARGKAAAARRYASDCRDAWCSTPKQVFLQVPRILSGRQSSQEGHR